MASQTLLEAVIAYTKTLAAVTALLNGGTAAILPAGAARGTTPYPYLTITDGGETGGGWQNQYKQMFRFRVYFGDDQSSQYPAEIATKQLIASLNRATIATITAIGVLEFRWQGYTSGNLFDYNIRAWYREVRFTAYASRNIA